MLSYEDKEFIKKISDDIINRLEEYQGHTSYVSDIGFLLTEGENVNGSWYCNTHEAKEEIKAHWDLFGTLWNYMAAELDMKMNVFDDVERFHDCAMINLYDMTYREMLSLSSYSDQEDIVINADFISAMETAKENPDFGPNIQGALEYYEDIYRDR